VWKRLLYDAVSTVRLFRRSFLMNVTISISRIQSDSLRRFVSVSDGTNCSGHIVMSTTDVRMNVLCPLHVTRHFVLWSLLSLTVVRQTRKAEAVPWREVLETCAAGGQVFLYSDGRYPCFFVTSCSLTAVAFSTFMTDENPASGYSTDPEKYHRPFLHRAWTRHDDSTPLRACATQSTFPNWAFLERERLSYSPSHLKLYQYAARASYEASSWGVFLLRLSPSHSTLRPAVTHTFCSTRLYFPMALQPTLEPCPSLNWGFLMTHK
jgi:hypothetical protein